MNGEESIFIVTHGGKQRGVDPLMKAEEIAKISQLRPFLPKNPTAVLCGTGQRHLDVARALDLKPTQYSGVAGDPESLEVVTLDQGKREVIILACGQLTNRDMCSTPEDMGPSVVAKLLAYPHNSVWCSGRPSMIALGLNDARSSTVYRIDKADGKLIRIVAVSVPDQPVVLQF